MKIVDQDFSFIPDLKQHWKLYTMEGDKFKCQLCPFESFQEGRLGLHTLLKHEKVKDPDKFKCEQCSFEAATKESMTNHIDGVHSKIRDNVCEICEESFSQKMYLNYHKETDHKMRGNNFECEHCPYESLRIGLLRDHLDQIHQKSGSHVCEDCGSAFVRRRNLKIHKKCHKESVLGNELFHSRSNGEQQRRSDISDDENGDGNDPLNIGNAVLDSLTDKTLTEAKIEHTRRGRPAEYADDHPRYLSKGSRPRGRPRGSRSELCDPLAELNTELETKVQTKEQSESDSTSVDMIENGQHFISILRPPPPLINVALDGTVTAKRLKREEIEESATYSCQLCSYKSDTRARINRHVRAVHAKIKEHICKECGAAFAHGHNLKSHNEAVHLKIKGNVCKECGASFTSKSNLEDHEKRHVKIKNHVCNECGVVFSRLFHLKAHYKSSHSRSWTKELQEDANHEVAKQRQKGLDAQVSKMETERKERGYDVMEAFRVDAPEEAELMLRVSQMEEKITGLKGNFAFIEVAQNAIAAKLDLDAGQLHEFQI